MTSVRNVIYPFDDDDEDDGDYEMVGEMKSELGSINEICALGCFRKGRFDKWQLQSVFFPSIEFMAMWMG